MKHPDITANRIVVHGAAQDGNADRKWLPFTREFRFGEWRDLAEFLTEDGARRFSFNLPYFNTTGLFQATCEGLQADDNEQGYRWGIRVLSMETGATYGGDVSHYSRARPHKCEIVRWWNHRGVLTNRTQADETADRVTGARWLIIHAVNFAANEGMRSRTRPTSVDLQPFPDIIEKGDEK